MADVTLTPLNLAPGTPSADLVGTGVTSAVTSGQTFAITAHGNDDLVIVVKGSGSAVVTVDAGDNPPSLLADKGSDVVATIANGEVMIYFPIKGRHVQSDGTITGSVASATVRMAVYRFPPGYVGTRQPA